MVIICIIIISIIIISIIIIITYYHILCNHNHHSHNSHSCLFLSMALTSIRGRDVMEITITLLPPYLLWILSVRIFFFLCACMLSFTYVFVVRVCNYPVTDNWLVEIICGWIYYWIYFGINLAEIVLLDFLSSRDWLCVTISEILLEFWGTCVMDVIIAQWSIPCIPFHNGSTPCESDVCID